MLTDSSRVSIIKKRRCFLWGSHYFQLDVFVSPPWAKDLMILEAYLANGPQEGVLPDFLPIKKEITGEKEYSLHQLALPKK
jgi:CYTH domain-containing protein